MIGEGAINDLCGQRAVGRYELFPAELVTSQACFVTHYLNTGVVEGTTVSKARHLSLFEFKPDTRSDGPCRDHSPSRRIPFY